ncbi:MAG: hypothetical protein Q6L68_06410 [Thermostichus sp. DG02_5_bins_236]
MRSSAHLLCFLVLGLFLVGCSGGNSIGAPVVDRQTPTPGGN